MKILLGITGSVAAIKAKEVIEHLKWDESVEVKVNAILLDLLDISEESIVPDASLVPVIQRVSRPRLKRRTLSHLLFDE